MRLRIAGRQLDRPAVTCDSFFKLPLLPQGEAQVVVGRGKIRLKLQRAAVAVDRFCGPAALPIRIPQVVVEHRRIAPHADRLPEVLGRRLRAARLRGEHAQQVQSVRLVRLGRKNPAVALLRGLQPAGLVVLDRGRQ